MAKNNDNHSLLGVISAFQRAFLLSFRKPGLPLNVNTAKANSLKAEKGGGGHFLPSQKLKKPVGAALEQNQKHEGMNRNETQKQTELHIKT